jgi:hypothetical protein
VLLAFPSIPMALLLGVQQGSPETPFFARIAGAALLAIGITCWLARNGKPGSAQPGLLTGVLTYDVAAVLILAYTGLSLSPVGIALWPAVLAHAALALWCVACTLNNSPDDKRGERS